MQMRAMKRRTLRAMRSTQVIELHLPASLWHAFKVMGHQRAATFTAEAMRKWLKNGSGA